MYTEPTLDDFKWATSVFWSRGLGLPVASQGQDGIVRIVMQEGLVPGLDFANHSQQVGDAILRIVISKSCSGFAKLLHSCQVLQSML